MDDLAALIAKAAALGASPEDAERVARLPGLAMALRHRHPPPGDAREEYQRLIDTYWSARASGKLALLRKLREGKLSLTELRATVWLLENAFAEPEAPQDRGEADDSVVEEALAIAREAAAAEV